MSTDVNKGTTSPQKQPTQPRPGGTGTTPVTPQRPGGKTRDQESAREFLWSEKDSQAGRERQQGGQAARSESEQQRRQRERNQPRS